MIDDFFFLFYNRIDQCSWCNRKVSKPFINYWCFVFQVFNTLRCLWALCHSTSCILQGNTVFSQNRKQTLLGVILIFVSVKLNFATVEVTGIGPLIVLSLTVHRQPLKNERVGYY